MNVNIKPGISKEIEKTVEMKDTATAYGSGLVEVFATPAMIALMENTAMEAVRDSLPTGYNTVGSQVNVSHIKATPVGGKVLCSAKLIEINDRQLLFEVEAKDEHGKIGFGNHTRVIINTEKFMAKLK
ncbi:MAG: thioesterase family protein [Bacteroidales bacterium]|nr:thioesterase family protein [Bacteroidales bacterium]